MSRALLPAIAAGLLLPGVWASPARADDWSLERDRPADREDAAERRRHRPPRDGRRRGPSPGSDAQQQRADKLIARYKRVLHDNPGDSFAFRRLLELYRERDGDVDALVEELEEERDADPEAYAPHQLLGRLYEAQGRHEDARGAYERAAELRSDAPAPWRALGQLDRRDGQLERARERLDKALEHTDADAKRRELLRDLGEIALEQQAWKAARRYYDRLARGTRGNVYLRTAYARALSKHGEHTRAVDEYERLERELRGDNRVLAPVLRDKARAQLAAGNPDDAVDTLERALRLAGRRSGVRSEIYELMIDAYRRSDRLPELVERLESTGPSTFQRLRMIGRVHDELGNTEEALEAYRDALRRRPRHLDTRVRIVQLLSRSGRIDKVIEEYRKLIDVAPREPKFVVELAQLLMQVGRREEALELAERTSRRFPNDPQVHRKLAELYNQWNEREKATAELERLVSVQPKDVAHLINLGAQQLAAGHREKAVETWKRILQVEPDKARAWAKLGGVYADHDMLERAEKAYRKAVERKSDELRYVRGLANVLERPRERETSSARRDRQREAIEWWRKVLELAEGDRTARREARQRIVALHARRQELRRHMARWKRRFEEERPDLEAGRFLAQAYLRLRPRRLQKAEEVLGRIIEHAPGDVESLLALERVQTARGHLAGAIETLDKLVEANPRKAPSYLQRMAEHALALYRDEAAVRYAERAVEHTPNDASAHRRLGDLYRARQDMEHAIASYQRAIELNERMYGTYFDLAEIYMARGALSKADRLFREVMRRAPDDSLVARAARASIQIHLGEGTLKELESELLPLALGHPQRPVYRKLAVELYDAMTRPLIRRVREGGADATKAARRLEEIGGRAIKPLLEALGDDDPAQRRVAIGILGHLGNPNAAGPLLSVAEGGGATELRARAIAAAGAVAEREHTSRFVELAHGPERRLRGMAAWSLARIGGAEAADAMRELLDEGDAAVRGFAALGLGRAGHEASASALESLLRGDRQAPVRACAAWALGRIGNPSQVPALVAALRGEGGLVARAAASALGRIDDPRGRAALAHALFDPSPAQQRVVATALERLERAPSSARRSEVSFPVPAQIVGPKLYLATLMETRRHGTRGPFELQPHREVLLRAARDALQGPVERVRTALEVLTADDTGGFALGPLTDGMNGWAKEARNRMQTQLTDFMRVLLPQLVETAAHPDAGVRERTLRLVSGLDAPKAARALRAALDDREEAVQRTALDSLRGTHASSELAARVAKMLRSHGSWSIRMRAARALGRLGARDALGPLGQALAKDDYAFVREAAARALGEIGAREAIEPLECAREQDVEPRVREAARKALAKLEKSKAA